MSTETLAKLIENQEEALIDEWRRLQVQSAQAVRQRISDAELLTNSRDFVRGLRRAMMAGGGTELNSAAFDDVRQTLQSVSRQWASLGMSPSETASFVFSFKEPLFNQLRASKIDPTVLAESFWAGSQLLDQLGLYTTETFQKSREDIITRQQQEMLELSTPVVELWNGILALPLIGTLDSGRTQIVMQNLLEALVARTATIAIIDITGVPTVDTLVAQHLLKTVAAAKLMGAECIISGIRPQIAQTIIHLGVDLGDVITKATMADAFRLSLQKKGLHIAKNQ